MDHGSMPSDYIGSDRLWLLYFNNSQDLEELTEALVP